ncbi:nucleotide exchange factor GrpE [Candidatus Jorgensenbacteria bacterium RIFCSPLOWO2_02_FULL_45_12]|uniref:Protein GrpE n=2 Tax=Candidatus Joergenseniibacteriota TaxID=1752739 RepID=A0A1F6BN16_9BACT|nr:MAG: Protein GrpE [Candidatus Jorgensenbacteria bacterium GW2011_GWA2_45_9]OGG38162.1 MAG: nucleotide exchange factor GrpE [Candidatus Jorgensenbacteria bacterium RIFCSPHIGHO2_02_FULL_45_20]OGG42560.1 MAG: nucleotide exchange factor GrpE [Candidatus Jorgensenbacteria bacterium RIFCSPLOWO2_02_FULL_45_12]
MDEDKEKKQNTEIENNGNGRKSDSGEYEECKRTRDEYLDGWKRAKADFINYKKEEAARVESLVKFANESLLFELLPVLDSFDSGIECLDGHEGARKGMKLIRMQLLDVLKQFGLEFIDAPPGTDFTPLWHEVVEEVESDEKSGTVLEEAKRGYVLNGKVIRPAKVRIAKTKNKK